MKTRTVKIHEGWIALCKRLGITPQYAYRVREGLELGKRVRALLEENGIKCRAYKGR